MRTHDIQEPTNSEVRNGVRTSERAPRPLPSPERPSQAPHAPPAPLGPVAFNTAVHRLAVLLAPEPVRDLALVLLDLLLPLALLPLRSRMMEREKRLEEGRSVLLGVL